LIFTLTDVVIDDWEFFYLWLKMISLGSSTFPFFYYYYYLLHANEFFLWLYFDCFSFLLILDWGSNLKILVLFAGEFC
jgi:hypothetical protein